MERRIVTCEECGGDGGRQDNEDLGWWICPNCDGRGEYEAIVYPAHPLDPPPLLFTERQVEELHRMMNQPIEPGALYIFADAPVRITELSIKNSDNVEIPMDDTTIRAARADNRGRVILTATSKSYTMYLTYVLDNEAARALAAEILKACEPVADFGQPEFEGQDGE